MRFLYYISLSICFLMAISFLIDNGNEINTVITSTANQLIMDMPIVMPIVAFIISINGIVIAIKLVNRPY